MYELLWFYWLLLGGITMLYIVVLKEPEKNYVRSVDGFLETYLVGIG